MDARDYPPWRHFDAWSGVKLSQGEFRLPADLRGQAISRARASARAMNLDASQGEAALTLPSFWPL